MWLKKKKKTHRERLTLAKWKRTETKAREATSAASYALPTLISGTLLFIRRIINNKKNKKWCGHSSVFRTLPPTNAKEKASKICKPRRLTLKGFLSLLRNLKKNKKNQESQEKQAKRTVMWYFL